MSDVTRPTDADVEVFLDAVPSPSRRRDARTLVDLMTRVTGEPPTMWGPTIVGFGTYHYRYPSGRAGDGPAAAFSPRSSASTIYLVDGVGEHSALLARLGPHTTGTACLYVKDLTKVDAEVLEEIVRRSWRTVTRDGFGARANG